MLRPIHSWLWEAPNDLWSLAEWRSNHGNILRRIKWIYPKCGELQTFSTLDEVNILAHKVELQRKAMLKRQAPKPPQRTYSFSKREPPVAAKPLSTPTGSSTPKPSLLRHPLSPQERKRCYKCQGVGHIASDCPNRKLITLAECQVLEEAE